MTEELKTLKDFNIFGHGINLGQLRTEAVKWVKDCCKEDANNEILRCDGCNRMVVFFNLTEEDLK